MRTLQLIALHHRSRAGFTAIEVSAVATIIAILALILIPIIRGRVEESRIVAAVEDMIAIEKAESLAFADTGRYFRLQDMFRPQTDEAILASGNAGQIAIELLKLPQATWDRIATSTELNTFRNSWNGPYLSAQVTESVSLLISLSPYLFRGDASGVGGNTGPIPAFDSDDEDWLGTSGGLGRARYPIDPFGNPYFFEGSGRMALPPLGADNGFANESDFGTAVVYSLGPDGIPGLATDPTDSDNYYRQLGVIGTGDDLTREF